MTNWTDELTRKQVAAARISLASELRISDHVQARRSEVDGWATVEVFIGRRCHTVSLGPKGGVRSKESAIVE
jgi:hypothetical protein